MRVLGVDPGFASFGWAIYALEGPSVELIQMGIIRTAPDNAKAGVLKTEDNLVRARLIYRGLSELVRANGVRVVAAESMSFPRNASVAAKMALSWGALASLSEAFGCPLVQASPQKVKKLLTGTGSASKTDIQNHVESRYPVVSAAFTSATPKGQHEHGFDAAAVVLACLDSEVFRMVRG